MSIFQAELYDKVHKKVMSNGPIEEMVKAYNMAMLTMNGEFEIRPQKKQKNGKALVGVYCLEKEVLVGFYGVR